MIVEECGSASADNQGRRPVSCCEMPTDRLCTALSRDYAVDGLDGCKRDRIQIVAIGSRRLWLKECRSLVSVSHAVNAVRIEYGACTVGRCHTSLPRSDVPRNRDVGRKRNPRGPSTRGHVREKARRKGVAVLPGLWAADQHVQRHLGTCAIAYYELIMWPELPELCRSADSLMGEIASASAFRPQYFPISKVGGYCQVEPVE